VDNIKRPLNGISEDFFKLASNFLVECFIYVQENNDLNDSQRDQVTSSIAKIYKFRRLQSKIDGICKEYLKYFNYFNKRDFSNVDDVYKDFVIEIMSK
jgi:hypothetical protein